MAATYTSDGGWIAPDDGRFYQCPDFTHYEQAVAIVEARGIAKASQYHSPDYTLEKLGWVHLSEGQAWFSGNELTQPQRDTLLDLWAAHPDRWGAIRQLLRGPEVRELRRPGTNFYPAKVVGKRLVSASNCPIHPKYQALRPPRSKKADCVCAEIWRQQGERI